jgi:Holliday junction resolvase RusA-like endonuclease
MLLYEFTIIGIPVSQQTRRKARLKGWKEAVRNAARRQWPEAKPLINQSIQIIATYYYEDVPLDTDNMIKPIQDALKGLVYPDDCLVTDSRAAKRNLAGSFRVKGMSSVLAEGFCSGREFIHVKILESPSQEELV